MQGQPPSTGRSWFRLSSMSSLMESPPQPSPEQSQPTFSPALAPPPPSPSPSQPSHGGSPSTMKSSPPPSPKIIKPATMASQAPIPEPESKSMLAPQPENISTQHSANIDSHNNNIKSKNDEEPYNNTNETKLKHTKKEGDPKWGTITIKGDNMGAYMDLANQNKKQSNNNNNNNNNNNMLKKEASNDKPMTALVNSNVQAINNSMVLNNAFAHKNPGVHLNLISRRRPMSSGNIHLLKA
ncbi:probable serine/threonine-protein kinase tsuA [Dioscorea cayenensis subsp. rotundata]|uniref:Probable serine/threonine-protein kinase tsuA n=1 Tax=Dioscorea cayennensis subsp. rotundata TaxID=55577 RepID=A0AB40BBD3_DIOCR|nr:probable serine/threonine-protein kinase tsuA [Dioscorea cayenensis subsp. rotundata]